MKQLQYQVYIDDKPGMISDIRTALRYVRDYVAAVADTIEGDEVLEAEWLSVWQDAGVTLVVVDNDLDTVRQCYSFRLPNETTIKIKEHKNEDT